MIKSYSCLLSQIPSLNKTKFLTRKRSESITKMGTGINTSTMCKVKITMLKTGINLRKN